MTTRSARSRAMPVHTSSTDVISSTTRLASGLPNPTTRRIPLAMIGMARPKTLGTLLQSIQIMATPNRPAMIPGARAHQRAEPCVLRPDTTRDAPERDHSGGSSFPDNDRSVDGLRRPADSTAVPTTLAICATCYRSAAGSRCCAHPGAGDNPGTRSAPKKSVRGSGQSMHDRVMTNAATNAEHGQRDLAMAGEILRTVVGSGVHGIAIAGTDDHDETRRCCCRCTPRPRRS